LWWSKLTHTATPFEILLEEEASCSTLASFPLLPPNLSITTQKLASFFANNFNLSTNYRDFLTTTTTFNMQNFGAPAPPMTGRACYNCTFSSLLGLEHTALRK
jgi:hypothetical protein